MKAACEGGRGEVYEKGGKRGEMEVPKKRGCVEREDGLLTRRINSVSWNASERRLGLIGKERGRDQGGLYSEISAQLSGSWQGLGKSTVVKPCKGCGGRGVLQVGLKEAKGIPAYKEKKIVEEGFNSRGKEGGSGTPCERKDTENSTKFQIFGRGSGKTRGGKDGGLGRWRDGHQNTCSNGLSKEIELSRGEIGGKNSQSVKPAN